MTGALAMAVPGVADGVNLAPKGRVVTCGRSRQKQGTEYVSEKYSDPGFTPTPGSPGQRKPATTSEMRHHCLVLSVPAMSIILALKNSGQGPFLTVLCPLLLPVFDRCFPALTRHPCRDHDGHRG